MLTCNALLIEGVIMIDLISQSKGGKKLQCTKHNEIQSLCLVQGSLCWMTYWHDDQIATTQLVSCFDFSNMPAIILMLCEHLVVIDP